MLKGWRFIVSFKVLPTILCALSKCQSSYLSFCHSPIRYKVIVYSATSRNEPKVLSAILSLLAIWIISTLLALPLFFGMDFKVIELPPPIANVMDLSELVLCNEMWGQNYPKGRFYYSIFCLLVQFLLPLTLISLAHSAIKKKLQKLPSWRKATTTAASHYHAKPGSHNNGSAKVN